MVTLEALHSSPSPAASKQHNSTPGEDPRDPDLSAWLDLLLVHHLLQAFLKEGERWKEFSVQLVLRKLLIGVVSFPF